MEVDYYTELGIDPNASAEEIRSAYHKLAMRWHPDRWSTKIPSQVEGAKKKFQKVQEAYSVLSNGRSRTLYDAGLYDTALDDDEDILDFAQEMVCYMADAREKKRSYGLGELRDMLFDMMDGQDSSEKRGAPDRTKRSRIEGHDCPTAAK